MYEMEIGNLLFCPYTQHPAERFTQRRFSISIRSLWIVAPDWQGPVNKTNQSGSMLIFFNPAFDFSLSPV
jgi:hypothetical protein